MSYVKILLLLMFSTHIFSNDINITVGGSEPNPNYNNTGKGPNVTSPSYSPSNPGSGTGNHGYTPKQHDPGKTPSGPAVKVKLKNKKMPACLVGNTLVETSSGLIEIKDVNEGDYVKSYNEITQTMEFRRVEEKLEFKTNYLVKINILDEVIETTPNHHFYVMTPFGLTAISAYELANVPRDRLKEYKFVTGTETYYNNFEVELLELEEEETVYDLTVEGNHNYRVTSLYILTHNCTYTLGNGIEKRQFFHHMLLVLDDPRPGHCGERLRIDFGPHPRFSDWDKIKGVFKGFQSADGSLIIQTIPEGEGPSFTFRIDDKLPLTREQAEEVLRYASKDIKKAIRQGKINYFVFNGPHKNDFNCIGLAKMIYKYAEQLKE